MTIALYGIALGGGITIGNAYILDQDIDNAIHHSLEKNEIKGEISRFEEAVKETRRELELLRGSIPPDAPAELGAFLSLNIMMLGDSQISGAPIKIIKTEECNAEWAIKLQADKLSSQFDEIDDEYLKDRKYDVIQVLERIFKNLAGNKFEWGDSSKLGRGILIANDLSPADLIHFKNSNFSGFVTEIGSLTSHTAIIGRNLEIPAVVGVGYARQLIRDEELIIADGIDGVLIINPEKAILKEYKRRQKEWLKSKVKLHAIVKQRTKTLDGSRVEILANIDTFEDVNEVKQNNVAGIGLFRSEFLFLASDNNLASEDEQFEAYYKIAKSMKNLPITIRTADLGADKNPSWNIPQGEIMNPALGLTGIRLSLADQPLFRTQLRAILRASYYGNIQIMFPMISSSWELKQAINQLEYAKEELLEEKIPFNAKIKIGAMIEVPSAALAIKNILAMVDFISIGTNDLIQFLLAIDRNDETVNYLYNPLHPAVLKIIVHIIKNCNKVNIPVSICGEIAGDTRLTRILLGIGLRKFSMYNPNILSVKNIILNTNLKTITPLVNKILKTENIEQIEELVEQLNADLNLY